MTEILKKSESMIVPHKIKEFRHGKQTDSYGNHSRVKKSKHILDLKKKALHKKKGGKGPYLAGLMPN